MLYAYCVRRAGEPGPDASLAGLDGAAVTLLEDARLGLWLSTLDRADSKPERLREHDRVVRAALRSATPLPLRFGALLPGEPAALQLLAERRTEWLAALDRVAGRVEMGVTVAWNQQAERERILREHPELRADADTPSSGREYLERRRRERQLDELLRERAQALLARVSVMLEAGELPELRSLLGRPETAGTLAHLVPREAVAAYRRRLEHAREMLPEVTLTLSGPWAPYSFV